MNNSNHEDIVMQAVKEEALNTISQLPDDTDTEKIMYRLMSWRTSGKGRKTRLMEKPIQRKKY